MMTMVMLHVPGEVLNANCGTKKTGKQAWGFPMEQAKQSLKQITIFRGMAPEALVSLGHRCSWREYGPGRQIVGHQDESRQVFFIVEGRARAIIYSLTGKQVKFRDIDAGEIFGEYAAIDGQPRSASVEAVTSCLVAAMTPELFWEVLLDNSPVAEATLKRMTCQLRVLSERIFEFSTLAVKNRIHAELLRLARDHQNEDGSAAITPAPTHADIASHISTHREAVTRELNELAHEGLVERHDGALIIHDLDRLETMVREVTGA
jgi:CRP-like cAMP-binding protein